MTNRECYAMMWDKIAMGMPLTPAESEWYDWYTRQRSFLGPMRLEKLDEQEAHELEERY